MLGSPSSCAADNCVTQLVICLFEMDVFEIYAAAIKNLVSGTTLQSKTLIVGHFHYSDGGDD